MKTVLHNIKNYIEFIGVLKSNQCFRKSSSVFTNLLAVPTFGICDIQGDTKKGHHLNNF